jgi:hypothetical protein
MAEAPAMMPTADELGALLARLSGEESATNDAERIDLIAALESLKSAAAAAQARITVSFDRSQRREQALHGVPAKEQGRGVASQVALARRDSPVKGNRHLGLAKALVGEMPHTLLALASGLISEWRATLMARETAVLSAEHRRRVDAELADRLATLGDAGVAREARKIGYRLDPGSALRRLRGAHTDRRVSLRPAPDTMSYLTGFLPAAQGIAVHTALARHADALRATGDARSRGQIMADTLVERVTGQTRAGATPVEVQLVMTDRALLGQDDTPARLVGYGPVPAALGRTLLRGDQTEARAEAWVRRLYTSPGTGDLVAMDSRRRTFPESIRRYVVVRDQVCRTPWCDAPIRHLDHVQPAAEGGPTSEDNAQGLCEACNYTKEAPGWRSSASRAGPGTVTVSTPTGHTYTSRAPDPPGKQSRAAVLQALGEASQQAHERFAALLAIA